MTRREQAIRQLIKYLETAQDWDVYEIVEWTFGYDDPLVEQFRDVIEKEEAKVKNESKRTDSETSAMQS